MATKKPAPKKAAPAPKPGILDREITPRKVLNIIGLSLLLILGTMFFCHYKFVERYPDTAKSEEATVVDDKSAADKGKNDKSLMDLLNLNKGKNKSAGSTIKVDAGTVTIDADKVVVGTGPGSTSPGVDDPNDLYSKKMMDELDKDEGEDIITNSDQVKTKKTTTIYDF